MAYISENTTKRKKALDDHEATKPGAYQSQYQDTINGLIDQVVNRKDFKYDFNADPLYHQYKDNYVQQGNQAMMNTMANAATLTGGFGNSYATSAGAQANQQYMSRLNDVIPELYNAAMDKYNMDTDKLVSQYGVATDADNRDYNRYADALANWQANRDYLYGQYMDSVSHDQWQEQWNYQMQQDALAAAQKVAQQSGGGTPDVPTANGTNVLKAAAQRTSNESTANYLAERVNDGSISMEQAQAIYAATQNLNKKKTSTRGGGANTVSQMTR